MVVSDTGNAMHDDDGVCGDVHAKEQQSATDDGDELVKENKRDDDNVTFESHLKCAATWLCACTRVE
jgi:hypothetical protein